MSDKNKQTNDQDNSSLNPDPKTLHKTDPQKNMEGPVSSSMQKIADKAEENDKETKEEADRKKDQNT
jgi:hypothetical protein